MKEGKDLITNAAAAVARGHRGDAGALANAQHAATAQQAACETATGSSRPTSGSTADPARGHRGDTAATGQCTSRSNSIASCMCNCAAARMAAGQGHTKAAQTQVQAQHETL